MSSIGRVDEILFLVMIIIMTAVVRQLLIWGVLPSELILASGVFFALAIGYIVFAYLADTTGTVGAIAIGSVAGFGVLLVYLKGLFSGDILR